MRSFKLNIIVRLLLITSLLGLLVYFIFVTGQILRSVYLGVFILIAAGEFIWYVDRVNRDLNTFFLSLLQSDFTTTFNETAKGKSFNDLYSTFNQITKRFKALSSEKETQHVYLEALIEHVKVGIISYDENEKIQLMNQAAKELLNKPHLLNLSGMEASNPDLTKVIRNIQSGKTELVKTSTNNEILSLSIHCSEFKLQNDYNKLISIQNIKNELDSNEMEAWQKLIRVLTHEIMNSVTPIASLTGTLKQIIENNDNPNKEEVLKQVWTGLEAIENRSIGLQSFTEAYRKLTRIPTPNFSEVNVKKLIERIIQLLDTDLSTIKVELSLKEDIEILGDPDLLNQVLINLIKNAIQSLGNKPDPKLRIVCTSPKQIEIIDNGSGIAEDKTEKIFIPFFTTKKEGSGIGLALSKQIMKLHNGDIKVHSIEGEGAKFILEF